VPENVFDQGVDRPYAVWTLAQGTEDPEAVERLEHGGGVAGLEVSGKALQDMPSQFIGKRVPGRQVGPGDVARNIFFMSSSARSPSFSLTARLTAPMPLSREAVALLELDDAILYTRGRPVRPFDELARSPPAGFAEFLRKAVEPSGVADVTEYGACFYGCELIPVAEEDQPGVGGERLDEFGEKCQVHHRGLIDHDNVDGKGVGGVVAEVR